MHPFRPSNYPENHNSAPKCVDLFCGAGGLTLGFVQAGGIPIAAVDKDKNSTETYRRMFPMCKEVVHGDIVKWKPETEIADVDVMIGGPPCQGFSLARGLRFVDDPRNHLYKEFVRLVRQARPAWIVMENVAGITSIGRGSVVDQIYEDFQEIGYWLDHRVINMADYGLPQTRKRAIFVGSHLPVRLTWPDATHFPRDEASNTLFGFKPPYVSVGQALGDLPWPQGNYFSHRANSQMRGPRNRKVVSDPAFTLRTRGDEFALCENPAEGAFSPGPVPNGELVYRPATHEYQRLMREAPPPWITDYRRPPTAKSPVATLEGTRRLTNRELARLQGFPDWFEFAGTPNGQGHQIGNAVPPVFAKQLFEAILQLSSNPQSR